MTIQFRAALAGDSGATQTGTQVVTLPTGWAAGDFCVIAGRIGNTTGSFTTPSGWTVINTGANSSGGYSYCFYYRVLQAGDSNPTFTYSVTSTWCWASIGVNSSVGAALSFDAQGTEADTTAGGSTYTPPAATASGSGEASLIMMVGRSTTSVAPTGFTSTPAAGWTNGAGDAAILNSGGNTRVCEVCYQLGVSGTVTPGSFSFTLTGVTTSLDFSSQQVLVSEAASGSPPVQQDSPQNRARRFWMQSQQPLPPVPAAALTFQGVTTLAGAGSITGPAVIQGAPATLSGTASLNAPAVIQGAPATLSGAASLNAPAVIQGAGAALGGQGSIGNAVTLGTGSALGGQGSIGNAAAQGTGSALGGAGSVGNPAVIQGAKTTLAGTGSISASGAAGGEQGPLHIILPGAWARITSGAFTLAIRAPALSLAALAGTNAPVGIKLPRPVMTLTGKVVHSVVGIRLLTPKTALAGKVTHNPLNLTLPKPALGLTGKRVHAGPLTIQLGLHRSAPRPPAPSRPREAAPASNPGYTTVAAGQHAPSSRPVTGPATAVPVTDSAKAAGGVSGPAHHPRVS